jgi:hypothetical protein
MATRERTVVLAMVIGFISSVPALRAADPAVVQPPPVKSHRFFDKQNFAIFSLDAAIMAADFATTRRALQVPGAREANPLMRSQGGSIAMKVAGVGAGMGIAYILHKSGHHRAERLVPLIMGVPSGIAAIHNAGIHP